MKTKKSEQANLERSKGLAKQMGTILALGFVFITLEYTNADIANPNIDFGTEVIVEADYVPITTNTPKPPPPPPPTFVFDKIIIVDNNIALDPDIELINVDIDDATVTIFDTDEAQEIDTDEIFITVEELPEFPGGSTALMQFLGENIKYPSICQELGIQGRVYIEFIVNKDGSIVNVSVLKGVDKHLDKEALRVIKAMPNWKPGMQSGKTVRVSYRVPINFALK